MKRPVLKLITMVFILLGIIMAGSAAHAMFAPPWTFIFNDTEFTSDVSYDIYTDHYYVYNTAPIFLALQNDIQITIPENSFSFFLKWDPYMQYDITFQNDTSENQVLGSFSFSARIDMNGQSLMANTVSAGLNGTVQAADQFSSLREDLDSNLWVNAGVDVQLGESIPPQPGPFGDWAEMRIVLSDVSIPTGESTIHGEFEINPVPVPAALWLLGSGIIGMLGVRRKKKID